MSYGGISLGRVTFDQREIREEDLAKITIIRNRNTKMKKAQKVRAAEQALERVGLAGKAARLPNQLSGGEQERVAIARAIAKNPPILLAEPTGNLDSTTSEEVMTLFRSLNEEGQTVVMVTHNPENCAYADRTISLRDGVIVEERRGATPARSAA